MGDNLVKVKEVPFGNLTLEVLVELQQDGVKAIVDGDKGVLRAALRSISEELVAVLETNPEAFEAFLKSLGLR